MKDLDTARWIAEKLVPESEVPAFIADRREEVRTMVNKNRNLIEHIDGF